MSTYTTQVRWICEEKAGPPPEGTTRTVLQNCQLAAPKIFVDPYPIWEESYRNTLNSAILRHYYFREIAFETVGLWKEFLNRTMMEIMPYYNKLYETTTYDFDVLNDVDIVEIIKRDRTDNESGSFEESGSSESAGTFSDSGNTDTSNVIGTESNTKAQHLSSDLPGATQALELGSDYYANLITKDTNDTTNTTGSKITGTSGTSGKNSREDSNTRKGANTRTTESGENVASARKGRAGRTASQLITEYRQSLLQIDMMIIERLGDLFFTLY